MAMRRGLRMEEGASEGEGRNSSQRERRGTGSGKGWLDETGWRLGGGGEWNGGKTLRMGVVFKPLYTAGEGHK